MAVVCTILLLCSNLKQSQFTIRTDHEEFKLLLTMTEDTDKLFRWRTHLLEFNEDVVHHARGSVKPQTSCHALKLENAIQEHWRMKYR